jgi:hypothetical protein
MADHPGWKKRYGTGFIQSLLAVRQLLPADKPERWGRIHTGGKDGGWWIS